MDKFLKYVMGIMGLLLVQMVEVKGDGTDPETGYQMCPWLVLALALLLCSVLSILTQLCQICCQHYIDEFRYGFRSLKEESEESIV